MNQLLTSAAAADRLGVTVRAVNAARVRGALRAAKQVGAGRRATYYYDADEIDRYGRERQVGWPKGKARKEPKMSQSRIKARIEERANDLGYMFTDNNTDGYYRLKRRDADNKIRGNGIAFHTLAEVRDFLDEQAAVVAEDTLRDPGDAYYRAS